MPTWSTTDLIGLGELELGGREEGGLDLKGKVKLNAGGAAQLGG